MHTGSSAIVSSVPAPPLKEIRTDWENRRILPQGVGRESLRGSRETLTWVPENKQFGCSGGLPSRGPAAPQVLSRDGPHSQGPGRSQLWAEHRSPHRSPSWRAGEKEAGCGLPDSLTLGGLSCKALLLCGFRGTSSNPKESDGTVAGLSLPQLTVAPARCCTGSLHTLSH